MSRIGEFKKSLEHARSDQRSIQNIYISIFWTLSIILVAKLLFLRPCELDFIRSANVVIAAKTGTPHAKLAGTIYTAADEIEAAGGKALPLIVDVRDERSVQDAVNATVAEFGGIDICINNASAISVTGTLYTPMKRYDLMHSVNGRGTFMVSQACLPHLLESKEKGRHPHILNNCPVRYYDH